ncbi:MAG: hypothetical protein WD995_06180 [Gemmatimonadota bacterium]
MSENRRARAMAASVAAAAMRKGLSELDVEDLGTALELAMAPREARLEDDHDPAFLHPGRVALILLRDEDAATPFSMQVGALLESRDPALRVATVTIEAELGEEVAQATTAVPMPGSEDLAERLVTLERPVALSALAERLDHLRHEHLRAPTMPWPTLADEVAEIWLPVAERTSETLARRYRHWLRTFERRL